MKYVIIDEVFPIIFSDGMNHNDFKYHGKITSAGRICFTDNKVFCFGESTSLKLKPAETDELRINTMLEKY